MHESSDRSVFFLFVVCHVVLTPVPPVFVLSGLGFGRLRNDVVPGVFPRVSFFATNLSGLLVTFDPRGMGGVIAFFPMTTTPFTDAGMTGALSESSLGEVGIFPLSSQRASRRRSYKMLFSAVASCFPTPSFARAGQFPMI